MVYIYDVLLNFNKVLYEYFEWEDNDDIKYIKKIPIYKVSSKMIYDIIDNNVNISNDFVNKITNKTKFYDDYLEEDYKSVCILSDGIIALGIDIDNNIIRGVSRMLFSEEEDVLTSVNRINEIAIEYNIIDKRKKTYLSRQNEKDKYYIKKEIVNMYNNKEYDKLKYYYFEYFNKDSDDVENIVKTFINEIDNNFNDKFSHLKNLINLTKVNF